MAKKNPRFQKLYLGYLAGACVWLFVAQGLGIQFKNNMLSAILAAGAVAWVISASMSSAYKLGLEDGKKSASDAPQE
jgi:hypothetical protein